VGILQDVSPQFSMLAC